jgi:tetratricopeptide (TPR) repeat protein
MSIREALRKAAPGSVNAARDVCNLLQRQGRLLNQLGEFEKSLATSNAADSILASFWKADLANFEIRRDMANLQSQIADSHDLMGNYALAENAGRKRLAICAELHRKNPTSDRSQEDLSSARKGMGLWLSSRGRNREAREHLRSALAEFKDLMRRNPDAGFYERKMVRLVGGLADVYQKLGEPVSACATYRDALALANRLQAGTRLRIDDQSEPDRFRKALASCP